MRRRGFCGMFWVRSALCVLSHEQNRGLGAALRTGFAHSRSDVVVTTDADGTYEFGEILGLCALLLPDVDVVTASPYHPEGGVDGVPAYRLLLSQGRVALLSHLA